jgi:hypothetical protein
MEIARGGDELFQLPAVANLPNACRQLVLAQCGQANASA